MSQITNLIFKNKYHYLTQGFSTTHNGADYGTNHLKINQYAIEKGTVIYTGQDKYGSKFIKIKYPRINKIFLHGHLDQIMVKTNDEVNESTLLGTTGQTGKATGIHLHLSIIDITSKVYLDPEKYALNYQPEFKENDTSLTNIKYTVKKGDNLSRIANNYHMTWQELYNRNKQIIGENPDLIYPGQILSVK